jgi:hypothetical protein
MKPVMDELAELSAQKTAAELNRRGVKSATGGLWYAQTVLRLRRIKYSNTLPTTNARNGTT